MADPLDWPPIGMTVEEAAKALRVHPRTVLDLIRRGDFPARKVGVGWRISPAAVEAWLASGNAKAEAAEAEND